MIRYQCVEKRSEDGEWYAEMVERHDGPYILHADHVAYADLVVAKARRVLELEGPGGIAVEGDEARIALGELADALTPPYDGSVEDALYKRYEPGGDCYAGTDVPQLGHLPEVDENTVEAECQRELVKILDETPARASDKHVYTRLDPLNSDRCVCGLSQAECLAVIPSDTKEKN